MVFWVICKVTVEVDCERPGPACSIPSLVYSILVEIYVSQAVM